MSDKIPQWVRFLRMLWPGRPVSTVHFVKQYMLRAGAIYFDLKQKGYKLRNVNVNDKGNPLDGVAQYVWDRDCPKRTAFAAAYMPSDPQQPEMFPREEGQDVV